MNGNSERALKGGGIVCINCVSISLRESNFYGLKAEMGGAIYIEQSDSIKVGSLLPSYEIIDCEIQNCESFNGGALYLYNPEKMQLVGNSIVDNLAYNYSNSLETG